MKIQEKSWEEWKKKVSISKGYAVVMCTDSFLVTQYPDREAEKIIIREWNDKLLDIRIFDSHEEYRLFRGDIGREFSEVILYDGMGDYYDDEQYLDIDTARSKKGKIKATGGGSYMLPFEEFHGIKIRIRNYLGYDGNGQAYIKAFRLVDFEKEDDNGFKKQLFMG